MTPLFEVSTVDVAMTNDEWYTPRWIFAAASLTFDMDVCAPAAPEFRTCPARRYLTVLDDGLTAPWEGIVWCNPPYSNARPWVQRWAVHPAGLLLVPTANSLWRSIVMQAAEALTLVTVSTTAAAAGVSIAARGFGRPDGSQVSYPTALTLAARGEQCIRSLGRVAAQDVYAGGAWFVRPGMSGVQA